MAAGYTKRLCAKIQRKRSAVLSNCTFDAEQILPLGVEDDIQVAQSPKSAKKLQLARVPRDATTFQDTTPQIIGYWN